MRSRILVCLLAGFVGGLGGALLQEALIPYRVMKTIFGDCVPIPPTPWQENLLVLCVGGLPGMLLGAADGVLESNLRKLIRGATLGFLSGFLLGRFGFLFGNIIYNTLGGNRVNSTNLGMLDFLREVVARAFGWSLLGIGIGAGASLSTLNAKRIARGVLGGFVGGFLGGLVFDIVAISAAPFQLHGTTCFESGGPSRIIGFTAIATATGLMVGIVEELLKEAWVRVLIARNEGRDFTLLRPINILGRDERCDVPLFGDPSVGIQHAAICKEGNRYVLEDGGTPTGTLVNGQPVPPSGRVPLRDGDIIQIGTHHILFRERATASKTRPVGQEAPLSTPIQPSPLISSAICPYCGTPKDAAGRCQCTVASSDPSVPSSPSLSNAPIQQSSLPSIPQTPSISPTVGRLVGLEGAMAGQVFSLDKPNITIGREAGRDIVLSADQTVSRMHAELSFANGTWILKDSNSSNGTFVNGMRITIQPLSPGDIVQFGSSRFRFE